MRRDVPGCTWSGPPFHTQEAEAAGRGLSAWCSLQTLRCPCGVPAEGLDPRCVAWQQRAVASWIRGSGERRRWPAACPSSGLLQAPRWGPFPLACPFPTGPLCHAWAWPAPSGSAACSSTETVGREPARPQPPFEPVTGDLRGRRADQVVSGLTLGTPGFRSVLKVLEDPCADSPCAGRWSAPVDAGGHT